MDFLLSLPLLSIHVTAVFTTLFLVVVADVHGLLWVLGKFRTLPKRRMEILHTLVWVGLLSTVTAGLLMFSTYSAYLLQLPAFRLKMLFVATLIINAFFIGAHMRIAYTQTFSSLSKKERVILLASATASTVSWIGALIAAQFLS